MGTSTTTTQETPAADVKPVEEKPKAEPKTRTAALSTKAILAAINDGDDEDPKLVDALQKALYRFGAQDPSMELPRSWQRVQRRIGADVADGVATAEQLAVFADRVGLTLAK